MQVGTYLKMPIKIFQGPFWKVDFSSARFENTTMCPGGIRIQDTPHASRADTSYYHVTNSYYNTVFMKLVDLPHM